MSETIAGGGSFLVRDATPDELFAPEDFTPEQRQYAKTARDFVKNEVLPVSDRIEAKDLALSRELVRKAGDLGLLMADVPEEFGGLALEKSSVALLAESLTGQSSWMMMANGHTGIGSLPVVYYGSQATKEKYLPALAAGSKIGCYALTEPTAGSDALSCRTRAVLSEDGTHYVLNGTKQFITNAGIADVFTVFAKVDGTQFTGFVLDRDTLAKRRFKHFFPPCFFSSQITFPRSHYRRPAGRAALVERLYAEPPEVDVLVLQREP